MSRTKRTISSVVTDDPLRDMPKGAKLDISCDLFTGKPKAGLNSIYNWDHFNGAVVALHFGENEVQRILGSGVLVAPGVVLTARHVIQPEQDGLKAGEQELICTGITSDGLAIWKCHQVTLLANADLALVTVCRASAIMGTLRQVTITTRMPRIGERLIIAGMKCNSEGELKTTDTFEMSTMVAGGTVTARYPQARDSVLLPSPCFEVNCPAIGGMSGGPAFDKDGFLVGLIASSVESEIAGPTFISLPWPALVEEIHPSWPPGLYKQPTSLLQMDRRLCAIHRPEAIQISQDDSTGSMTATLHHWE